MIFPQITLAVGDALEDSYAYILERFIETGLAPQPLEDVTRQLPCGDRIALFTLHGSNRIHIFVVVTDPWEEELLVDLLNSLLSLRQSALPQRLMFHFFSAHPLPEALGYIFGADLRADLECDALVEIRFEFGPDTPADRPGYLARQCQCWIQDHFHHTLYPQRLETLAWINQLVLEQLRDPVLPHETVEAPSYEPVNSLIALGCFVGEVLAHQPQLQGRWVRNTWAEGMVLQLCPQLPKNRSWLSWPEPNPGNDSGDWTNSIIIDPVGKVIKLFREGAAEDLTVFAEVVLSRLEVR